MAVPETPCSTQALSCCRCASGVEGGDGLARAAQGGGDGFVLGQRLCRVQPAALGGDATPLRRLGPSHETRSGNVAAGV